MSKLFKTLVISAASGSAAAYFLTTKKGKELRKNAEKFYGEYKENPEEYHQIAKDKASEYSNLAVDTFKDYKGKFESGELTTEDIVSAVKEKSGEVVDFANDFVNQAKSKFSDEDTAKKEDKAPETKVEDIVIDYKENTEDKEK